MSRNELDDRVNQMLRTRSPKLDLSRTEIADEELKYLASESAVLFRLRHLDLSWCRRVTDAGVAAVAERLTGLTQLDLRECRQVTDVGVAAVARRLTGLTQLDLSYCQVTDAGVAAVARRLTGLTQLRLDRCLRVTDAGVAAVAQRLSALTQLDLAYCKVTDAEVAALAERLSGLTQLGLSGCDEVTDAGVASLAKLSNLRILDLSLIPGLSTLPSGIRSLPHLEYLNLRGNVALGLPVELTDGVTDSKVIFDHYFRGKQEGNRPLNEAKMLVVGNEAAGKTSLVNFLIHDIPAHQTPPTQGVAIQERIDVSKWDVTPEEDGQPLRLNVWDFGGQEVQYETHRFFLTARSLYLLVLEARRENARDADELVHEWVRAIKNKAGDPPILVVINKSDSGHDLRLDETRLRVDYPNIIGFARTSCLDPKESAEGGRGIKDLRRTIADTVRHQLPHVRDLLPESYFRVKEALNDLARRESVLDARVYHDQCTDKRISDPIMQVALLDLLDQIGVVVKYNEATLLDPNWLTSAVYKLLTHARVKDSGGEFVLEDLGRLLQGLSPEKYPRDRWGFIVEMMKRFHLCFELRDQPGRYLIPEQLPSSAPYLQWDVAHSLRFRFGYDQIPHGLIPRFIVETHDLLPPQRAAWANGVILKKDECTILVQADWKNRNVNVFVLGLPGLRRAALAVIRDRFSKVHLSYVELKPKALVPLPDRPELAVDYGWLVRLESLGKETCLPPGSDREYSVAELLNNVDPGARRPPQRSSPEPPNPPEPSKDRAWAPLVGAGVVGAAAVVVVALLRWDPIHWVTVSTVVFLAAFAIVYLVQVRHQFKVDQWPKYMVFLLGGAFPVLAAMPGLKLILEEDRRRRLEFLIDNSPWMAALSIIGALGFGFIEYGREGRARRA